MKVEWFGEALVISAAAFVLAMVAVYQIECRLLEIREKQMRRLG